jgi:hypothetical protein
MNPSYGTRVYNKKDMKLKSSSPPLIVRHTFFYENKRSIITRQYY